MRFVRRPITLWLAIVVLLLGAAALTGACGDDDDGDAAAAQASEESHQADQSHEEDEQTHDADEHEELDASEARTITVEMSDFAFTPDTIEVERGEVIRLVLHNTGTVLHDMTLEDFIGHAEAQMSAMHSDSEADDHGEIAFHAAANAGEDGELLFRAEEAGVFDLFCSVAGHGDLGMVATLIVSG